MAHSSGDPKKLWRFYMELAPYGELYGLLHRYCYLNRFLPEAFLWHVFDSLAEAAQVMANCSTQDLPPGNKGPKYASDRLVNFDIKTPNIFLGYAEHRQSNRFWSTRYGGTRKYDSSRR